ncbi:hypothetical protein AB1K84_07465 [Mesobacillus foraminis]
MSETSKAVIIQAGNEEFALPIFNVISIEKMEEITPYLKCLISSWWWWR